MSADSGHACPTCGHRVVTYHRTITGMMAATLIETVREHERRDVAWVDIQGVVVPRIVARRQRGGTSGDYAKLRYWGLIESFGESRVAPGSFWRVTHLGLRFAAGMTTVPRWAEVEEGRLLRLYGPPVSIHAALGRHFSWEELARDSIALARGRFADSTGRRQGELEFGS